MTHPYLLGEFREIMEELVKVTLDNEMDLIVAHKRAMKLAEMAGLSLASQTTFATAVSEVARYAMEQVPGPMLTLGADSSLRNQSLTAVVEDKDLVITNPLHQGLLYAQRLVDKLEVINTGVNNRIVLHYSLRISRRISTERLADWRSQFNADQPLSAYDEIKQKNEQLRELAMRLQASEHHYRQVTNSLPLMIFTVNESGQLLYANHWTTEFTGSSVQTLNQTKWLKVMHPDDQAVFWEKWAKQIGNERFFQHECRLREEATQTYFWHLVSAQPANSERDKFALWTGFAVNIDAQKIVGQTLRENEELAQAKNKLEQSQRKLEATVNELNQSNDKLSQFAYIASHDLQEPLRKIQQFGDLLRSRNTSLPSEDLSYLERMQAAAGRMSVLIKDLLSYSRLSTRLRPSAAVSLDQVLLSTLENLSVTIEETNAQIQLEALPTVQGDSSQLGQLFQNLMSNALKFRQPAISPIITISSKRIPAMDLPAELRFPNSMQDHYRIDVADNGIGFDIKYLNRIFQVFQRLHTKSEYSGTGVGLAICEKVVTNHGGAITATSQPGFGATFTIYLPA